MCMKLFTLYKVKFSMESLQKHYTLYTVVCNRVTKLGLIYEDGNKKDYDFD